MQFGPNYGHPLNPADLNGQLWVKLMDDISKGNYIGLI